MTILRFGALGALALWVAACVPEFRNPIVGGERSDPALIGSWRAAAEGDEDAMRVEISEHAEGLRVAVRGEAADPARPEEMVFVGPSAQSAEYGYLNLKFVSPEAPADMGHLVFRYARDGDGFKIWALDPERLKQAVESGAIAGSASGAGSDTSVKIVASSPEALAFLESAEGRTAFLNEAGDILVLTRIPPSKIAD